MSHAHKFFKNYISFRDLQMILLQFLKISSYTRFRKMSIEFAIQGQWSMATCTIDRGNLLRTWLRFDRDGRLHIVSPWLFFLFGVRHDRFILKGFRFHVIWLFLHICSPWLQIAFVDRNGVSALNFHLPFFFLLSFNVEGGVVG